jgi:hypothetical protein
MKRHLLTLALLASSLTLTITAFGQTAATTNTVLGPIATVTGWITSLNSSNVLWQANKGELHVLPEWIANVNGSVNIGGSYNVYKMVALGADTSLANVSSEFLKAQGSLGLNLTIADVQVTPSVGFGYSMNNEPKFNDKLFVPLAISFKKGLGQNSPFFSAVTLESDLYFQNKSADRIQPLLKIGIGVVF